MAAARMMQLINFNPPSPCGEGPNWRISVRRSSDFNPPSPCGEGPVLPGETIRDEKISIHPPRVGRDLRVSHRQVSKSNFNPPSPCGEGQARGKDVWPTLGFQSTLPVWGGTTSSSTARSITRNFNPPSPCGEGRQCPGCRLDYSRISIHPPRVGRDWRRRKI